MDIWLSAELAEAKRDVAAWTDCAEYGWTVIANASGGDWKKESLDWQQAAEEALLPALRAVDRRQGFRGPLITIEDREKRAEFLKSLQERLPPEAIEKAIAKGIATTPTITPAMQSDTNFSLE